MLSFLFPPLCSSHVLLGEYVFLCVFDMLRSTFRLFVEDESQVLKMLVLIEESFFFSIYRESAIFVFLEDVFKKCP